MRTYTSGAVSYTHLSTDIELTKLKAELERVKKLKKSIYEDYKDELISKEMCIRDRYLHEAGRLNEYVLT